MRSTYVVSDIHGHPEELVAALRRVGLVDGAGDWCGLDDLWFLGDYVDRGPDGVAVIDLVRRWQEQSAAGAGLGTVEALLGNHEVLALGKRWFGEQQVPSTFDSPRSFHRSWSVNGGLAADQEGLDEDHVEWLVARPLLAKVGETLLAHSDTEAYLDWGSSIDEVNATAGALIASRDIEDAWTMFRKLTTRHAFHGPRSDGALDRVLTTFGAARVVHGHSTIGDAFGIPDAEVPAQPHVYAAGRAVAIDGGLYDGGPLIVARLEDLT